MFRTLNQPSLWAITLAAAGILMVTMGARQSLGLFLSPLNTSHRPWRRVDQPGDGRRAIHLGRRAASSPGLPQTAYGPSAGAAGRALAARPRQCAHAVHEQHLGPDRLTRPACRRSVPGPAAFRSSSAPPASACRSTARGAASGVINAGGSFGQFVFAPILQALIQDHRLDGGDVVAGADDPGRRAPGAGAVSTPVGAAARAFCR
jgi:hypothetical protein